MWPAAAAERDAGRCSPCGLQTRCLPRLSESGRLAVFGRLKGTKVRILAPQGGRSFFAVVKPDHQSTYPHGVDGRRKGIKYLEPLELLGT